MNWTNTRVVPKVPFAAVALAVLIFSSICRAQGLPPGVGIARQRGISGVSVLLGDGKGDFSSPATFAAGSGPAEVVAADFNGGRKLDVAVTISLFRRCPCLLLPSLFVDAEHNEPQDLRCCRE
jgi:hypothetical protein